MSSMIFFTSIGALIGTAVAMALMWMLANKAQQTHPHGRVYIADLHLAHAADDLAAWAHQHGYQRLPSLVDRQLCYRKGRGWLTSATEIRLYQQGVLDIDEVVNFLFTTRRFALNAPIMLGKPVRARKLKAVNQLLAQWHIEPLVFMQDQVTVKIKTR